MIVRHLLAAALCLLAMPAFAKEAEDAAAREAAIAACSAINSYGPVTVEAAAQDGLGDWVVWISDKDGDLWMCNASGAGDVYVNVVMEGDLLKGDGAALIADDSGGEGPVAGPAAHAEELCLTLGTALGEVSIAATASDGMGDYLVWLRTADETYVACNASADAQLFAFETVDMPLDGDAKADKPPVDARDI